jgi:hypothetical protein
VHFTDPNIVVVATYLESGRFLDTRRGYDRDLSFESHDVRFCFGPTSSSEAGSGFDPETTTENDGLNSR